MTQKVNANLWNKIQGFDFDSPMSEYGFSTRLANENYWTRNFTEEAILEYKKFMYLAATSDFMVSPSEIVDVVWHQHLIFTQSYQNFCNLIDKQVQHIPSTHNREDFARFKQAKERTTELYTKTFGEQPKAIWNYSDMYESLNLEKANLKIRTFLVGGILSFLVLTVPFYFVLRPLYVNLNNPYFMLAFVGLIFCTFIGLEIYNRNALHKIIYQFNSDSFVFNLQALELVYMKTQKLEKVINGYVNEFVKKKQIRIHENNTVEKVAEFNDSSKEAFQISDVFKLKGRAYYSDIQGYLLNKPIFSNTVNCIDALKKYFVKSKKFGWLFYINFTSLALLLMTGVIRLTTGVLRGKAIDLILIADLMLVTAIIFYLNRLTKLVCTVTIPKLYEEEILPRREKKESWEWKYFIYGDGVITTPFVTLVNSKSESSFSSDGGSSSSSCVSSCGSSCSSCGGCGGGD